MKRIFYFLMTLVMLVSCTDKVLIDYEVGTNRTTNYIEFGTNFATPKATKSIITGIDSLRKNKFAVYAKVRDAKGATITVNANKNGFLIYGDTLIYDANSSYESKWFLDHNKHYFWPKAVDNNEDNDPTLDFYAFGPREINNTITEASGIITVDVNPIEIDQEIKDLVTAKALVQTYKKDGVTPKVEALNQATPKKGYVKFDFAHKLSWILFDAKCDTTFKSLTIDSIKVYVANSTAQLVINTTGAANSGVPAYSDSLINAATSVSHIYKLDSLQVTHQYDTVGSFVTLPQALVAADSAVIFYHYTDINDDSYEDLKVKVALHQGDLHEEGTVDHAAATPTGWTIDAWKRSYKYIYRIHFTLREILFDVSVTPWTVSTVNGQSEYLIY
jgi:hypothetical protein